MNFKERAKELVSKMTLPEKMAQMRYDAPAIPRLGIPAYNWWNECLHGVARSGVATVFPQAIGMAASFNTKLMHSVAEAISNEARAKYNKYKEFGSTEIYQGLTYWSPNINIFRDPRWGRGHETYGEDPYLTATMGVEFVKGLQEGEDPKYRKLDATIKHYAVHSGPEQGRGGFDAVVNKKDLYETYLYAFKYCIDNAEPAAVMGAYNRINGEPSCASKTYLKETLFGELGFDGYVVSDCGAICNINKHHHITKNEAESAALAVNNGCHLNCGDGYKWLKTAVALELISEETITEAVERLFEARIRLGMFDKDCVYDLIPYSVVNCEKHQKLNRKMAQESMVLLKNDGILPLSKDVNVAVIGPNSDDISVLLGNYNGTPAQYTTLLGGIQEASEGKVLYARGCHVFDDKIHRWAEHPLREAIIAAKQSDVVIMCMGLNPTLEGEESDAYNGDLGGDKMDLELPASQQELYNEIVKTRKPIIFVNVSGSAINLSRQNKECSAVLQCFYPGAEGGHAFADILYADAVPSGKLPVTFYESIDDLPPFEDYNMKGRTYRYFDKKPLYPFGYGLSYSEFKYSNVQINKSEIKRGEDIHILVDVENTGRSAAEVVQIYIKYPDSTDEQPKLRLVAYEKVYIGEKETVQIELTVKSDELMVFDDDGKRIYKNGILNLYIGGGQPGFADVVERGVTLI